MASANVATLRPTLPECAGRDGFLLPASSGWGLLPGATQQGALRHAHLAATPSEPSLKKECKPQHTLAEAQLVEEALALLHLHLSQDAPPTGHGMLSHHWHCLGAQIKSAWATNQVLGQEQP